MATETIGDPMVVDPSDGSRPAPETRRTSLPPLGPPTALSSGPLGEIQAADREIARLAAVRARAVAAFAESRPASVDRQQGEPGAMSSDRWAARSELLRSVSEWATRELSVALSLSANAAEALLERSLTLVHRLPGTLTALEAGALHSGHLWPMLDKVAPVEDPAIRADLENCLIRWAQGRVTTPAQLGAKARRELIRRDAWDAARRLERALRDRGVHWRSGRTEGMGAVTAALTLPEARVLVEALGAYADAIEDDPAGAPRTRGQKMADCLMDLVLRPGESELPPVQVVLTLVASVGTMLGGDAPAEIDGQPVPAELARALLRAVTGRPAPEPAADRPLAEVPDDADRRPAERLSDSDASDETLSDMELPFDDALDELISIDAMRAAGIDVGTTGEDVSRAWDRFVEADLLAWGDEMERRILSGELDDLDPPPPDGVPPTDRPAGAAHTDPPSTSDHPLDSALTDAELTGAPLTGAPSTGTAATDASPSPPSTGSRWWRDADRAVDAAGQALFDLHQTMGAAQRLVRTAVAADRADEAAWRAGPGGRVEAACDALEALAAATERQRDELGRLLTRTGGGGLVERPRIAVTSALDGALLALTDLPGLRRAAQCGDAACRRRPETCDHDLSARTGLGPPAPTDGYRPGAELDRFVRARDRRCRFPGCRRRVPRRGQLDHDRPYPTGPTSAENLAGYCTTDHRGKHQAPGWRHRLDADGTVTVTTPTGLVASTSPPPY